MSRTYTVPIKGTSTYVSGLQQFVESGGDDFFTSDGLRFYVRGGDGTVVELINVFTVELESRSYEVPN